MKRKSIQQIQKQAFDLLIANAESANETRAKQIIGVRNRYCDNIERFWQSVNYDFVKNVETGRSIYAGY